MTHYDYDPRDQTYGAEFEAYDREADECGCPRVEGEIRHRRGVCTDPVVARLGWYADDEIVEFADRVGGTLTPWQRVVLAAAFPAFPPGIEGIPHKSHYVVADFIFCHEHGKFCGAPANVCTRGHVHDTPKEAVACDRLDLLTESRDERAYRLGLDTENAPDSTV